MIKLKYYVVDFLDGYHFEGYFPTLDDCIGYALYVNTFDTHGECFIGHFDSKEHFEAHFPVQKGV